MNCCDIKLLITLLCLQQKLSGATLKASNSVETVLFMSLDKVALYLRKSQCHYAVTVSFISPSLFAFIYLSLSFSVLLCVNGGHVY